MAALQELAMQQLVDPAERTPIFVNAKVSTLHDVYPDTDAENRKSMR